jgi:hypothetical protein
MGYTAVRRKRLRANLSCSTMVHSSAALYEWGELDSYSGSSTIDASPQLLVQRHQSNEASG